MAISVAELLLQLEEISRSRADRVLRLRGALPVDEAWEPFELLIFRGFSSSVSHPTDFDPDQPLLPEAARIEQALREALVDGLGLKPRFAFGPLRTAVSGQRISPPLFESMEILGKDETLARLRRLRAEL